MKVTGETCNFKAYLWQDIKNNSRRRLLVLSNCLSIYCVTIAACVIHQLLLYQFDESVFVHNLKEEEFVLGPGFRSFTPRLYDPVYLGRVKRRS